MSKFLEAGGARLAATCPSIQNELRVAVVSRSEPRIHLSLTV